jgi:hypothetical protein
MREVFALALLLIGIGLGAAPWLGAISYTPELTNNQVLRENWFPLLLSVICVITGSLMTQYPTKPTCPHCGAKLNPVEFIQKKCGACKKSIE